MKNKVLVVSLSLLLVGVGIGVGVVNSSSNPELEVTTKMTGNNDVVQTRKEANENQGAVVASDYISNALVQSVQNEDETYSLRFVSLIKASYVNQEGNAAVLPGDYGFHVEFNGVTNTNYSEHYKVNHFYNSISETVDGVTTYYTNEYSSVEVTEGNVKKSIADLPYIGSSEYDFVVALTIEDIPATHLETLFKVNPYVEIDGTKYYSEVKHATVNNVNEGTNLYFVQVNGQGYNLLTESEGSYSLEVELVEGDIVTLVNQNSEALDASLVASSETYSFTAPGSGKYLISKAVDGSVITKRVVEARFSDGNAFTYNGEPQSPTFKGFKDTNGVEVTIPESAYTIHYSSATTGYYSSEAPSEEVTEETWYAMVVTFNSDAEYIFENGRTWGQKTFHVDPAPEVETIKVTINFNNEGTYEAGGTPTIASFTDVNGEEVEVPESAYTIHYEDPNETNLGSEIPTEAGTYSFVVTFNKNSGYEKLSGSHWAVFTVTVPVEVVPVTINFNNVGTYSVGETPTIASFTNEAGEEVAVPESAYTIHYENSEGTNIGSEVPTEKGRYSMVVLFNENSGYKTISGTAHWAPYSAVLQVSVTFTDIVAFTYDGNAHAPTIVGFKDAAGNDIEISSEEYTIHYEKEEKFYSYDAPTEVGWYSMVLSYNDGSYYSKLSGTDVHIVFHIDEPTPSVTFNGFDTSVYTGGIYEGTVNNMFDGNLETHTWFGSAPEEGANIVYDIAKVKVLNSITIYNGKLGGTGDYFHAEVLVSKDNVTYTSVGTIGESYENVIDLSNNLQEARYIKLLNTGTGTWVAITDIQYTEVEINNSVSYENIALEGSVKTSELCMIDGNNETYTWFGVNNQADASVILNLQKVKEINQITLLMSKESSPDDFFHEYQIYVSTDGVDYLLLSEEVYTSSELVLNLDSSVSAQYIKVQATKTTPNGVVIREFSASNTLE